MSGAMQKEDYGNRLIGVDLLNPQFPGRWPRASARAGVRTTSPEGLGRELAAALKRRGTTLIEVAGRRDARPVEGDAAAAHPRVR